MTITAAPTVPNPNSATFAADAYPFTQWMAALGPEIDAETARINSIGFGAYSATSTTSLTVGTGSKSLTIEAGKSFAVGQPVVIASTAAPTNYMTGQVTSYNSGTGALVVNVTSIGGSGTVAAWTISIASIVAGGGVSPDSIVVLTSGTSWTCPAGVTKVRLRIDGACGGGIVGLGSYSYRSGANGGYLEAIATVVPGTSYAYTIGAGGAGGVAGGAGTVGGTGGTTTFTANGITFSATGGGSSAVADASGAATGTGAFCAAGNVGLMAQDGYPSIGAASPLGNRGGTSPGTTTTASAGDSGKIILELYK